MPSYVRGVLLAFMEPDDPRLARIVQYVETGVAALRAAEPPAGTRLILASEDLLAFFGTRTEDGDRLTAEWGERKPEGWYEPVFTRHADDNPLRAAEEREARLHRVGERFADDLDTAGLLDWADRLRAEWRAALASMEEGATP